MPNGACFFSVDFAHPSNLCVFRTYKHVKQNFSEGPHCRIVGPGSLKESSFTNVFLYPKKYYKTKPFSHPRDAHFEGARMGSYVTCMDGLVEKRVRKTNLPTNVYVAMTTNRKPVALPSL